MTPTLLELIIDIYISLLKLIPLLVLGLFLVGMLCVPVLVLGHVWDASKIVDWLREQLEKQRRAPSAEDIAAAHVERLYALGMTRDTATQLVRVYPAEKLAMLQTYDVASVIAYEYQSRERQKVHDAFFGVPGLEATRVEKKEATLHEATPHLENLQEIGGAGGTGLNKTVHTASEANQPLPEQEVERLMHIGFDVEDIKLLCRLGPDVIRKLYLSKKDDKVIVGGTQTILSPPVIVGGIKHHVL